MVDLKISGFVCRLITILEKVVVWLINWSILSCSSLRLFLPFAELEVLFILTPTGEMKLQEKGSCWLKGNRTGSKASETCCNGVELSIPVGSNAEKEVVCYFNVAERSRKTLLTTTYLLIVQNYILIIFFSLHHLPTVESGRYLPDRSN